MIPHVDKRHKNGEDACYSSEQLLVVLDGVGGWNEQGVDPGLFTKELIKLIEEEFKKDPDQELKPLLDSALKQSTCQGTSTAVLLKIDADRPDYIKTINLGDSGYLIFRKKNDSGDISLQFRTKEQQHFYDCPF